MKLKDLKVGEEYAAGSKRYPSRVTLLSVGGWVPFNAHAMSAKGMAAREKTGAAGCRVRRELGGLDVIMPAQICSTWAEYERSNREKKNALERAVEAQNLRSSRSRNLASRIDALLPEPWGGAIACSYIAYSDNADKQDAYLAALEELVDLAERAGRGEGCQP